MRTILANDLNKKKLHSVGYFKRALLDVFFFKETINVSSFLFIV